MIKLFIIFISIYCFVWSIIIVFELSRKPPRNGSVRVFFGKPGAGKTSFASSFVYKRILSGKPVWSNVPIKGAYKLSVKDDIGTYQLENGYLIVDEAGIDYNNRQYMKGKGLNDNQIEWWKLIRHYHMVADVFSQSYDDMDITLRRLASDLFIIKRSLIPKQFICKRIRVKVGIDEHTHQIINEYKMGIPVLDTYRIRGRKYWKFFDSYDAPILESKDWELYSPLEQSRFFLLSAFDKLKRSEVQSANVLPSPEGNSTEGEQ